MIRRMKLCAEAMRLSLGQLIEPYAELAYLESTGVQYINTGLVCNENSTIKLDYTMVDMVKSSIFGSYTQDSDSNVVICRGSSYAPVIFGDQMMYIVPKLEDEIMVLDSWGCDINGFDFSWSATPSPFTSGELCLFDCPGYADSSAASMKLYSAEITIDGTVHELIPKSDSRGVVAMWNKTTNTYLYNAGSGSFLFGYKEE